MDNLNPEFLFPEISKQTELFVSLMKALSTHLKPAPYPYGLLTLRLLGKLGGKNRRVLREPMDIKDPMSFKNNVERLTVNFCWHGEQDKSGEATTGTSREMTKCLLLPLSIERCVEVIRYIVTSPVIVQNTAQTVDGRAPVEWKDSDKLWDIRIEDTDFLPYCLDVMRMTQKEQAESALRVLRVALNQMMTIDRIKLESVDFTISSSGGIPDDPASLGNTHSHPASVRADDRDFELVSFGLMLGCAIESVGDECLQFAKGFLTNAFAVVVSHQCCFSRVDANGSTISSEEKVLGKVATIDFFHDDLGSLKPFGYFEQTGALQKRTNPLAVNKSLAELLAQPSSRARDVGLILLRHILKLPDTFDLTQSSEDRIPEEMHRGVLILFDSLLSALCEKCIVTKWNRREGLYSGICLLLQEMGGEWSRKYEMEVMNVALFSLKSVPREMSMASVKAFEFVVQVCITLYGAINVPDDGIIFDILASEAAVKDDTAKVENSTEDPSISAKQNEIMEVNREEVPLFHPSNDVLQILITELASTRNILR